jgi:hypothetical protein
MYIRRGQATRAGWLDDGTMIADLHGCWICFPDGANDPELGHRERRKMLLYMRAHRDYAGESMILESLEMVARTKHGRASQA